MIVYRLRSVIDNWPHRGYRYNQVDVTWFKEHNDLPVSELFGAPIIRLDDDVLIGNVDPYAESQADECFTVEQADALAAYLKTQHGTDVIRELVTLPLPSEGYMGVSAVPVGGNEDFYMLFREDEYDVSFKVSGYYRIDGAESYIVVSAEDGIEHVSLPGSGRNAGANRGTQWVN